MQAIHPQLSLGQQGDAVGDLHVALTALGHGAEVGEQERDAKEYGEQTAQAVAVLQTELNLVTELRGTVDEPTADAINRQLFDQGLLWHLSGAVRTPADGPAVGNLLLAFDVDNVGGAYLGTATTGPDGDYALFYDPLLYATAADGVLRVKDVI